MMTDSFAIAMELESAGDVESAAICYQTLMADDARAAVNLGVIRHNAKAYGMAADAFRHALKLDPEYALAWFNLGNTLEALLSTTEAIKAYEAAVGLCKSYGDANFNLARLLEVSGRHRAAVKYWRAFIKLEPVGQFADRARRAIKRTVKTDKLKIVYRGLGK